MSELLPAPFGPRRPNMRLPIVSERFFNAFTPFGYVLDRPVIVSAKETALRFRNSAPARDRSCRGSPMIPPVGLPAKTAPFAPLTRFDTVIDTLPSKEAGTASLKG